MKTVIYLFNYGRKASKWPLRVGTLLFRIIRIFVNWNSMFVTRGKDCIYLLCMAGVRCIHFICVVWKFIHLRYEFICLLIYVCLFMCFWYIYLKFCINWLKGNGYIGVGEKKQAVDWQFNSKTISSTIYEWQ